jgi:Uma2 family endonuclease
MATILDLPEIRDRAFRWTVAEYEKLGDDPAFRRTELIRGIMVNKMSKSPLHSTITTVLADSMPEPDVSVMRGTVADFAERHPSTAALVVEVAISSVTPDRENASLYAEAGVTEYWIILGEAAQVEVYRRPDGGVYQEMRVYRRGETIAGVGVTGGEFAVETLFA